MKWCKGVEVERHTFSIGVLDNVGKFPASYCGRLPAGWLNPMEYSISFCTIKTHLPSAHTFPHESPFSTNETRMYIS